MPTCAERLVSKYGGRRQLAEAFEMTTEGVRLWVVKGIPLACALDVERKSGGFIRAEAIVRERREAMAQTEGG